MLVCSNLMRYRGIESGGSLFEVSQSDKDERVDSTVFDIEGTKT